LQSGFISSCRHGHLKVAQWLMKISRDMGSGIDLHDGDEEAFRYACEEGHLEIAEWLIELSREDYASGGKLINIHVKNDYAFTQCRIKEYTTVWQWLKTLNESPEFHRLRI